MPRKARRTDRSEQRLARIPSPEWQAPIRAGGGIGGHRPRGNPQPSGGGGRGRSGNHVLAAAAWPGRFRRLWRSGRAPKAAASAPPGGRCRPPKGGPTPFPKRATSVGDEDRARIFWPTKGEIAPFDLPPKGVETERRPMRRMSICLGVPGQSHHSWNKAFMPDDLGARKSGNPYLTIRSDIFLRKNVAKPPLNGGGGGECWNMLRGP